MIEERNVWIGFSLAIIAVLICQFLLNLVRAPGKMEKDSQEEHRKVVANLNATSEERDRQLRVLEEERIPKFAVAPLCGKRSSYDRNELTAWADLGIENTNPSVALIDVSVKIVELTGVYEKRTDEWVRTGVYFLGNPVVELSPASVFWSGRTREQGQFSRTIRPHEREYATIAFHPVGGNGLALLNTLNQTIVFESRIAIEVSGTGSNTWRGEFYIEYKPIEMGDEFVFVDWDSWCKTHTIIEKSNHDK